MDGVFKDYFISSKEIRKVLNENPDLPVLFEVLQNDEYGSDGVYTGNVTWDVGEYLDYDDDIIDGRLMTDREDVEDEVCYDLNSKSNFTFTYPESKKLSQTKLREYEKHWKKCVIIYVAVD